MHWLNYDLPGRVAQSVTCLATDPCLTADPGVASSIPARSHTFVEIDHEMISTVILLPSADSFKKGCCQLQAKVRTRITGYPLVQACPGKSVVRWTSCWLGTYSNKTNKQTIMALTGPALLQIVGFFRHGLHSLFILISTRNLYCFTIAPKSVRRPSVCPCVRPSRFLQMHPLLNCQT